MARLIAFNNISLDGFFSAADGGIGWTHQSQPDAEYDAFVSSNASGGGMLVLGRVTYEMMASFWPTPMAAEQMTAVAAGMNSMPKLVFSRTLREPAWSNTRVFAGDIAAEIRRLKAEGSLDMAILGSGSIVAQLADEGLIDEYQVVLNPVVLGSGRSQFAGLATPQSLRLSKVRSFANGKTYLSYDAVHTPIPGNAPPPNPTGDFR